MMSQRKCWKTYSVEITTIHYPRLVNQPDAKKQNKICHLISHNIQQMRLSLKVILFNFLTFSFQCENFVDIINGSSLRHLFTLTLIPCPKDVIQNSHQG